MNLLQKLQKRAALLYRKRRRARKNEYDQYIGHWDNIHHKFIVEKHIIHEKQDVKKKH